MTSMSEDKQQAVISYTFNNGASDEELFSYVLNAVFNDFDEGRLLEYRSRFLILLIAYGGHNRYCKPEILISFDKTNMEQYDFAFVKCPDNYHLTGEILDAEYNVVATV